MSRLKELLDSELKDKSSSHVPVERLVQTVGEKESFIRLGRGLFYPDVGVYGDWSEKEKEVVRKIMFAREQGHSLGHEFGRAMTGYDDPNVAKYKEAYSAIDSLSPGDLAKVKVEEKEYFIAAFPAGGPATALALFVK